MEYGTEYCGIVENLSKISTSHHQTFRLTLSISTGKKKQSEWIIVNRQDVQTVVRKRMANNLRKRLTREQEDARRRSTNQCDSRVMAKKIPFEGAESLPELPEPQHTLQTRFQSPFKELRDICRIPAEGARSSPGLFKPHQ